MLRFGWSKVSSDSYFPSMRRTVLLKVAISQFRAPDRMQVKCATAS